MKEWIIPAIVIVVWILNALLRNKENDEPVRKPRGKTDDERPDRSPVSDIDRFLQEIERMKKKAGEAPAAPKPVRPRVPAARPMPAAAVPRVKPVVQRIKPGPGVAPPAVLVVQPPAEPKVLAPSLRAVMPPTAPPPSLTTRQAFAGALALLRTPNAAQQAIALNEILGPPKALRRHS